MTTLHKTNHKTAFTIEGRKDIDLSLVFSRDYFNVIGFKHFHISHKYKQVEETQSKNNDLAENPNVIVQDLENSEQKLSDRVLGEENLPNGYTELPLKQTGGGIIETVSEYITPFFSSKRVVDENTEGKFMDDMKIMFDTNNTQSFDEWKNEQVTTEVSLFSFRNTTITYDMIERIIDDLHAQFCYLHDNGFTLRNISTDFVYMIDNRLVLLDGNAIQVNNTPHVQDNDGCKAILDVIFKLLGKKDLDVLIDFSDIRYTGLYYTLMRLQNDGVFVI